MARPAIKVAVVGLGTVGAGVAQLLSEKKERLSRALGADLVLAKAVDRRAECHQKLGLPGELCGDDALAVIDDPEIDIVVELMGGLSPAKELVTGALARGKGVVTANKHLLAKEGADIFAAAQENGASIAFEASVGGGIPLIRSLREGLAANRITSCMGILNGTCNYLLTRMGEEGLPYGEVLADAQAQGLAEADPTFDVEGIDTAHKLAIVAALVTGRQPDLANIPVEGITRLTPLDLALAAEFNYKVKLLAILTQDGQRVEARVHPALVPLDHVLASVDGAFNALHLSGDWVGDVLLYGLGAGSRATASAVVGDVLDLARERLAGCPGRVPALGQVAPAEGPLTLAPLEEAVCQYYLRFMAQDRPGVLAGISRIMADHHISIEAVIQKGRETMGAVPIVMITHDAAEAEMARAMAEINRLEVIMEPPTVIRRAPAA